MFSFRDRLATKRNMPRPMVCRQNRMSMKVKNLHRRGTGTLVPIRAQSELGSTGSKGFGGGIVLDIEVE